MIEPKFKIGQIVFKGEYERTETTIVCPDCGGSAKIKVTLADLSEWLIECGACAPGSYSPPTGTITQFAFCSIAKQYTVTGVKMTLDLVAYDLNNFGTGSYWTANENDLFATPDEALIEADKKKTEHEATENKRFLNKIKDTKTWAWNLSYHRKCIADHEKQLEYHKSKVQVCRTKVASREGTQ